MTKLTQEEIDRVGAFLFADEESLTVNQNGASTIAVDADDIEAWIEMSPIAAKHVFGASFDYSKARHDYDTKWLGEYTKHVDGSVTFEAFL